MKSVLMSIQPKWCELIASGKKTVEVRKTKPKIEAPFKVYIYCTKDKERFFFSPLKKPIFRKANFVENPMGNGKIIGEFICDEILDCRDVNMDNTCLTVEEWLKYTKGHKGVVYGWHISNLVIYDKPRELSEFRKECKGGCDIPYLYSPPCENCNKNKITRPPQSWCYVESEVDA